VARIGIRAAAAAVLVLAASGCLGGMSAAPVERHLVYVKETTGHPVVWIAHVDGSGARRLARGSTAVLTPDGRTVAIGRSGGIFLVSSHGGSERRLTARHLRPQAWSPDGQTLVATASTARAVYALVALDRATGRSHVLARGSLYGFSFSPKGNELVYSRAPEPTFEGICGDQFDLYTTDVTGGKTKRVTHDGLSAFPAWGDAGIAFTHFPSSGDPSDCSANGVWTMDADGSNVQVVIARAPDEITLAGYYGFQPLAWLDKERVLVGLRTDSGTEGTVLDTKTGKLRRLGDYTDLASSDGRFSIGSGGDQSLILSMLRLSDGHRVLLRKDACCPSWNR
jgi:hypothetical protein